jgi:hypothetical protein
MGIAERTRLAADLHDSLSQNLTAIGYQVSTARNTLGGKDLATTECLDTAASLAHRAGPKPLPLPSRNTFLKSEAAFLLF